MKKITLLFCLALLTSFVRAQGLECVVVEVYYVSNAADSVGSVGILPNNSVTYRLWADMLPGYKLQAVYGVDSVPLGPSIGDHELRLETTTTFFNNEDYGTYNANTITIAQTDDNSVMIDSWFSMGGNASGKVAVPKPVDTDGAIVNVDGILQNNDPQAGTPISVADGMIAGTSSTVQFVGIPVTGNGDLEVFNATSQVGNLFTTTNGAIAVLGGVSGPDTATNKVLIGQFTTDGVFTYKLNLQLGTSTGGVERYVAENPVGSEILLTCLYDSILLGVPNQNTSSVAPSSNPFSVYPNPASNVITINYNKTSGKIGYAIYDITGKMILEKKPVEVSGKYSEQVDISSMVPGMYLIKTVADGVASYSKLVKK